MLPDDTQQRSESTADATRPFWRRWLLRAVLGLLFAVVLVVLVSGWWVRSQLQGSLPTLDGEVVVVGLSQPVTIERDAAGVPTLRGESRLDVARALGYLHAQERFFQLDLIRRQAAGELSELVGPGAVGLDRRIRTQRFRSRAESIMAALPAWERELMVAYSEGVNAGLEDLSAPPFEYLVLQAEPAPWRAEDSILVVFAMYIDLQGRSARREVSFSVLHDAQPALYEFLTSKGDQWDAPLFGEAMQPAAIPSAEAFDLRREAGTDGPSLPNTESTEPGSDEAPTTEEMNVRWAPPAPGDSPPYLPWLTEDPFDAASDLVPGSNNWAVDGARSRHGGAMLANDMHLGHSVPNIWFRAVLVYPDPQTGEERRMAGVSLPGTPAVVAGSNGHVAWGFTNSYGDWTDLVVLESADGDVDSETYLTPDGPRTLERITETIKVKGQEDSILEISQSIWGPVIDRDAAGRRLAHRWTAHLPQAINLGLVEMEGARTVDEAIRIAHRSGVPAQNFVVVDDQGRIGWTIIGPFPRRVGYDGLLPTSWADGTRGWDGLLTSDEVPTIVDPASGRLWTANARTTSGEMYERIGDGGFARGARAQQIRDGLLALDKASEADMLAVQLDDRALFLERWRTLLTDVLKTSEAPRHQELLAALDDWTGRASPDSVAYTMVRSFRDTLREQTFHRLTLASQAAHERFDFRHIRGEEGPLWQLVEEQPMHLLDPAYDSWNEQFLAAVDAVLDEAEAEGGLATQTWGQKNRLQIRHPLSRFMPAFLAAKLDMPTAEIPGDRDMPRVQANSFGASERLVVSPGREEEGFFHMPTGQSGHPLSPYYQQGFWDWANGEPSPFLPGETRYRLILKP